jgi:hypothetical protein
MQDTTAPTNTQNTRHGGRRRDTQEQDDTSLVSPTGRSGRKGRKKGVRAVLDTASPAASSPPTKRMAKDNATSDRRQACTGALRASLGSLHVSTSLVVAKAASPAASSNACLPGERVNNKKTRSGGQKKGARGAAHASSDSPGSRTNPVVANTASPASSVRINKKTRSGGRKNGSQGAACASPMVTSPTVTTPTVTSPVIPASRGTPTRLAVANDASPASRIHLQSPCYSSSSSAAAASPASESRAAIHLQSPSSSPSASAARVLQYPSTLCSTAGCT